VAWAGQAIRYDYQDPTYPTDTGLDYAMMYTNPTPSTAILADGIAVGSQQAVYTIDMGGLSDTVYLEVADDDENNERDGRRHPHGDGRLGLDRDTEVTTLTETGVNTAIFRAGVPPRTGPASRDGTCESQHNEEIRISYQDDDDPGDASFDPTVPQAITQVAQVPGTVEFVDASGNLVDVFTIGLEPVYVQVNDWGINRDGTVGESFPVNVSNTFTVPADAETLTLSEVDPVSGLPATNTGVFRSTVPLKRGPEPGGHPGQQPDRGPAGRPDRRGLHRSLRRDRRRLGQRHAHQPDQTARSRSPTAPARSRRPSPSEPPARPRECSSRSTTATATGTSPSWSSSRSP